MKIKNKDLFLIISLCLLEFNLCFSQDSNCLLSNCTKIDNDLLKAYKIKEKQSKPYEIKIINVTPTIKVFVGFSTANMFLIEG